MTYCFNVGKAYSGNQSEIDPYLGEAYFFRAYNYFYLLKYFGGVPIITVPLDTDSPELQNRVTAVMR